LEFAAFSSGSPVIQLADKDKDRSIEAWTRQAAVGIQGHTSTEARTTGNELRANDGGECRERSNAPIGEAHHSDALWVNIRPAGQLNQCAIDVADSVVHRQAAKVRADLGDAPRGEAIQVGAGVSTLKQKVLPHGLVLQNAGAAVQEKDSWMRSRASR
jgi:hypothetical protein